jgi:hypothetical protein
MRDIKKIIIHHSLTEDGQSVSWDAIRNYHTNQNKWSDIGYHFGIELVDNDYEVFVGRPMSRGGAHTKGQNGDSIGICCVGNYDKVKPPRKMLEKLIILVKDLMGVFGVQRNQVFGHNNFCDYKSCPGASFDMDNLRRLL